MNHDVPAMDGLPAAKESKRYRLLRLALSLMALHVAITLQLFPVIGIFAVLYAMCPPVVFFTAYDAASDSPLFALVALGTSVTVWLGLREALHANCSGFPRLGRWLMVATLAIWVPVACGEAVHWSLMQVRIANANPQCHHTTSLLASLRQRNSFSFDGSRQPHAWMIRNGEAWLWSYRSLRFEAVPDWYRAGDLVEACEKSMQ